MARTDPIPGHDFDVDLGDGSPSAFVSVVFPEFKVDGGGQGPLVLRRALSENRDLQKWWGDVRAAPSQARNIAVTLVKGAERAPVLRWRFINARPVSLGYSPLDAMHSAMVFEALTLSFERVEMEWDGEAPAKGTTVVHGAVAIPSGTVIAGTVHDAVPIHAAGPIIRR